MSTQKTQPTITGFTSKSKPKPWIEVTRTLFGIELTLFGYHLVIAIRKNE